jgi:hypothetical protein
MAALCMFLLTSCREYMVAEGIGIFNPEKYDGPQLTAEYDEGYTLGNFVDEADVIARVKIEDLTHVEVFMEEKDAHGEKGIFASMEYIDVYYTWSKGEYAGGSSNVFIDYTPIYANVDDPGLEEGKEYIVFLKRFSADEPFVYYNFYDYYLINDYRTYVLQADETNMASVIKLIDLQK